MHGTKHIKTTYHELHPFVKAVVANVKEKEKKNHREMSLLFVEVGKKIDGDDIVLFPKDRTQLNMIFKLFTHYGIYFWLIFIFFYYFIQCEVFGFSRHLTYFNL